MYKVVVVATTTKTNVAPYLKWSTYNKQFDTVDNPHLFNNQFETETSTYTINSLTWKQNGLRDSRFKNPRHQGFKNRVPSGKAGEDVDAVHKICCPSGLFFIHITCSITCYYHTYTTILGKHSDIIKGDRDNNEGVLHYENRFQTFR